MARIRTIKPEFPQSESMGRVGRGARLLFILLWTILDDEGRARGNSRMLSSLLYPYDDDAATCMAGWLDELSKEGCVQIYSVDGAAYIQALKWEKHQKIDKPSKSRLPPPPINSGKIAKPLESSSSDLGPRTMDQDLVPSSVETNVSTALLEKEAFEEPQPESPQPSPPSQDDKTWIFNEGLRWLAMVSSRGEKKLRPQVGKWLKTVHSDHAKLRKVFEEAMAQGGLADPISWLTKAVEVRAAANGGAKTNGAQPPAFQSHWDEQRKRLHLEVKLFRDGFPWARGERGPAPGETGCTVPPEILKEFGYAAKAAH